MRAPMLAAAAAASLVLALPVGIVLVLSPEASSSSCGASIDAPAGRFSQGEMTALWTLVGGSTGDTVVSGLGPVPDPVIAGAVGMAESGGDSAVVNSIGAGGLWQIHPAEPGYLDPATNARMAVRKFSADGWRPWEAFTGHEVDGQGDDGPWRAYLTGGAAGVSGMPDTASCGQAGRTPDGTREMGSGAGPWLADVPGMPGIQCDTRIVADVAELIRRYHVRVTACYAPTGHEAGGEHPLGLAVDLVPGPGGSWDDVDQLARDVGWTQACGASGVRPACPLKAWVRFVGWNGYPGHGDPAHAGRNAHLHASWAHGPGRPAETVTVFSGATP